jgi:hypothetical protein
MSDQRKSGNPFSELIQNFMMLSQVKQMQEQAKQQDIMNTVAGFREYTQILREGFAEPEHLEALENALAQKGFDRDALIAIRRRVTPTATNITAAEAIAGRDAMDPESRGVMQGEAFSRMTTGGSTFDAWKGRFLSNTLRSESPMGEAMRTREATGQTPGQFAMDQVLSRRGEDWIRGTQDMEAGHTMTAAQQAQNALGLGNLDLGRDTLRAQNTWEIGRQGISLAQLALQRDSMMAKAQADGNAAAFGLIEEYGKAVRSLVETKSPRTTQEITAQSMLVNSLAQQLADQWLLPAQWYATNDDPPRYMDASQYTPEQARAQGWRPIAPTMTPNDVAYKGLADYIQR